MTVESAAVRPVPDQSLRYGEQYHDVYQHFFPPSTAADVVARVQTLVEPAVAGQAPVIAELGVGTGRIAIPLALAGADVLGVDSSEHLLDVARRSAAEAGCDSLVLEHGDLRTWRGDHRADLACCVCATISMLATADEQRAALAAVASAVRHGGTVVVETHDPHFVRNMHRGQLMRSFPLPVPGLDDVVATSLLQDGELWQVEFTWSQLSGRRTAREFSRLTEPAELQQLAADVGLMACDTWGDWGGATPACGQCPTYIATFRRCSANGGGR